MTILQTVQTPFPVPPSPAASYAIVKQLACCSAHRGQFPQDKSMAKLKLKTHKGAAKRFKKTATGKIKRNRAFARHIFTSKSPARKRRLHQATTVDPADAARVLEMLPY